MLGLLAVVVIAFALLTFIAGWLPLIRNPNKDDHRYFFLFALVLSIWLPVNYFDSFISERTLTPILVKVDFGTALLIGWFFLMFTVALMKSLGPLSYVKKNLFAQSSLFHKVSWALNTAFFCLSIAGLLAPVTFKDNTAVIGTSIFLGPYAALLVFYFVYALLILGKTYKKVPVHKRKGLDLIWLGFFIAATSNVSTNLIFPNLIEERATVKALNTIGYLGMAVMVGCIYFAITAKKLFDIRLIVARTAAYIMVLGSFTLIFVGGGILLTSLLLNHQTVSISQQIVYLLISIIIAIIYQPVRRYFNKLTNRLFYRDAYDVQVFLDELNKVLIGSFKPLPLVKKSADIIESNLKTSYCVFGIKEPAHREMRIIGTAGSPSFTEADMAFMRSTGPHIKSKLIIVDQLDRKHSDLQAALQKKNIAIIARLTTAVTQEGVGYLILGPKKSGNVYTSQDLRVLEIIANELVIAVQNALRYEEIESFNLTLQEKVNEATKGLRRANEKLKALDETKDDFISMASHQLRTPLTSIRGYLSMTLEGDVGELAPKQREMISQAYIGAQRMVYIIADLLNVSRLKTGKFVIDASPVQLAEVVSQELSQLQEEAKARGIELTYDKPETFPELMLDETKTRQVIMNFTDNALYYTPPGGHVRVSLTEKPHTVELRITDDGIGVPKSEQPHLFTKFYRAGNARKARPDGTGLGLFMAKKVIVSQGGSVLFESREGRGSTFGFAFSKEALAVPQQASTRPMPLISNKNH